jgi:tRNA modification GTPase
LTNLQKQIDQRSHADRPFRVVLAGKPNAGKSSLFNALVGADAALIDAAPGTTRDYLTRVVSIDDVKLELIDTAGLRQTDQAIEASAQALGREALNSADLVVWCVPCDDFQNEMDSYVWLIATKTDLGLAPEGILATSAVTGAGIADLRQRLADEVRRAAQPPLAPALSRCRHHVAACLDNLRHAHALVIDDDLPELLALELRLALEELGAVSGAVYTDDLLDRIFSRFCIGK